MSLVGKRQEPDCRDRHLGCACAWPQSRLRSCAPDPVFLLDVLRTICVGHLISLLLSSIPFSPFLFPPHRPMLLASLSLPLCSFVICLPPFCFLILALLVLSCCSPLISHLSVLRSDYHLGPTNLLETLKRVYATSTDAPLLTHPPQLSTLGPVLTHRP